MNIFATSRCPKKSAQALDNLRLPKMVLESAQMICTVLRHYGASDDWLYRATHINHPCTLWAQQNRANFIWLCTHARECTLEHLRRGGKFHISCYVVDAAVGKCHMVPRGELSPFVNCTKDFKHVSNVHEAYKLQLAVKWNTDVREPAWTGGAKFKWINQYRENVKGLEV